MRSSHRLFLVMLPFLVLSHGIGQTKGRGLDPATMDASVKPCENFYLYANGTWMKRTEIPAAFSQWGSFTELAERNRDVLHAVLEEAANDAKAAPGSSRKKIGDFFASGMDSATIETLGWKPIEEELRSTTAITSLAGIRDGLARMFLNGGGGVFTFRAGQDQKNSTSVIIHVRQGGLGMPDRDYYLLDDSRSKNIRNEYLAHLTTLFTLVEEAPDAARRSAESVLKFETRLAKGSRSRVDLRDSEKNYSKMSSAQLEALMPDFGWPEFFSAVGIREPADVNVGQPEFLKEVNAMMKDVPLEEWRQYLRARIVRSAAPLLSSPFVAENFRFYRGILTGTTENLPRWKRVQTVIDGSMGEALGELYVARAFPPKAKLRAQELVRNLREAFRQRILVLEWMDDSTRNQALHKLAGFAVKIGYPDTWRDYSSVTIHRSAYFENVRRCNEFEQRRNIAKIGKPVDRTEWNMTPPTVNAYYSSTMNEIVFPAGILQPPFFDFEADDAVNYGGIGAVIGHELGHGFDDQGSKFDADGNMNMWWTASTRRKFENRTAVLVKQYDGFVAIDSMNVNGKLTLGENIGDLGGLSIAYAALQNALNANPRPLIDGFTPEQRFFLSWAQIWRRNVRPEQLRLQIKTDPHSPAQFRVNGPLANMREFQQAFGCPKGSALALPESEKVAIW